MNEAEPIEARSVVYAIWAEERAGLYAKGAIETKRE